MQVFQIPVNSERMELTQHGSYDFPLAVYETVLNKNVLGFVDWHWHDELQLCVVTSGAVCFCVGEKRLNAERGQGIFIAGGRLHSARPVDDPCSSYLCLNFLPKILGSFSGSRCERYCDAIFLKNFPTDYLFLDPACDGHTEVISGAERVAHLHSTRPYAWETAAAGELMLLWFRLLQLSETQPRVFLREDRAVRAVLSYIDEHYAEPLTAQTIANAAALSVGQCCRVFRRVTGETVFSYLRGYRVAKAAELLKSSGATLEEIASEVGLCSAGYLIRLFKERTGTTPHRYRQNGG